MAFEFIKQLINDRLGPNALGFNRKYSNAYIDFIHRGRMIEVKVPDAKELKGKIILEPLMNKPELANLAAQAGDNFKTKLDEFEKLHKKIMDRGIERYVHQVEQLKQGGEKDLSARESDLDKKFNAITSESIKFQKAVVNEFKLIEQDPDKVKAFEKKLAETLEQETADLINENARIKGQISKRLNHKQDEAYCHNLFLLHTQRYQTLKEAFEKTPVGKTELEAGRDVFEKYSEVLKAGDLPVLQAFEGFEVTQTGNTAKFTLGEDLTSDYTIQRSCNTLAAKMASWGHPPGSEPHDKTLNLNITLGPNEKRPDIKNDVIELYQKQVEQAWDCGYRDFNLKLNGKDITGEVLTKDLVNKLQGGELRQAAESYEKSQYLQP